MMTAGNLRKRYDGAFKAKVVLEVLRGQKTIAEIASHYGIHPNQITAWKKQVLDELPRFFSNHQAKGDQAVEEEKEELYRQIGQLKVGLDWLQKNLWPYSQKKERVNRCGRGSSPLPAMRAYRPGPVELLLQGLSHLAGESPFHEAH